MDNKHIYNFYYKKYKKKQNGGSQLLSNVNTTAIDPLQYTNINNYMMDTPINNINTDIPIVTNTDPLKTNNYPFSQYIDNIYSYFDYDEPLYYGNSHNIFPIPGDSNNIIRMGKKKSILAEPYSKINRLNKDSGIFSQMEIYEGNKPKGYEDYEAVIMPKLYPITYEDIEEDFEKKYEDTKYFKKIMDIGKKLFRREWNLSWGKSYIEIDYLRLDNIMADKDNNVLFNDVDDIREITKEIAQKNLKKIEEIEEDFIKLGDNWTESEYFNDIYEDGNLFPFFSFSGYYT